MEDNMITVESLTRRIELFIEDNNWEKGIEYCNRVLDMDPENSKAYLLLLLCSNKVQNLDELAKVKNNFDLDPDYKKAYKYGDKEQRDSLDKYLEQAKERKYEKEFQDIRARLSLSKTKDEFERVIKDIEKINDSEEAAKLLAEAKNKYSIAAEKEKEEIYEDACRKLYNYSLAPVMEAKDLFENLKGYKDSKEKLEECSERIARLQKEELKRKKQKKMIISIVSAVIIFFIIAAKIDLWHLVFPVFSSEEEMINYLESSNWERLNDEPHPVQVKFYDGSMHFYYENRNQYEYEYKIENYRAGRFTIYTAKYTVNKAECTFTEAEVDRRVVYEKTDKSDLIVNAYSVEETKENMEKEKEEREKKSESTTTVSTTAVSTGSVSVKKGSLSNESLGDYYHITGTVTNTTNYTVTFVMVKISLIDSNGNVIDTDSTYAVGSEGLAPGESSRFEVYMDKISGVKKYSASVYDYDYKW